MHTQVIGAVSDTGRFPRRLGLPRYGYLLLTLGLLVLAAVWAFETPAVHEMMLIEFEIPHYEREYGFRGGWLDVPTTQGPPRQAFGIVSVEPAGRLAHYGFRRGDIPVAHHGDGLAWFCEALERVRTGEG